MSINRKVAMTSTRFIKSVFGAVGTLALIAFASPVFAQRGGGMGDPGMHMMSERAVGPNGPDAPAKSRHRAKTHSKAATKDKGAKKDDKDAK
jgi:hypothetical protein